MNTRIPPQPQTMRKAPQQQRSRTMVDAILEAATRILSQRGWAKFTTNEVAIIAGVSVGSLYQYFPNKLALAEAIRCRHLDAVLTALAVSEAMSEHVTLDQRVTCLIDGVIAAHSIAPALHRILLEQVPLADRSSYEAFETEYHRRYRRLITENPTHPDTGRDDVAGRVLAAAVEGVVHNAARRGELGTPTLRRELINLVSAYLQGRSQYHSNEQL